MRKAILVLLSYRGNGDVKVEKRRVIPKDGVARIGRGEDCRAYLIPSQLWDKGVKGFVYFRGTAAPIDFTGEGLFKLSSKDFGSAMDTKLFRELREVDIDGSLWKQLGVELLEFVSLPFEGLAGKLVEAFRRKTRKPTNEN